MFLFAGFLVLRGWYLLKVGVICLPSRRYRKTGFLLIVLWLIPALFLSGVGYLAWSDYERGVEKERLAQEQVDLFRLRNMRE